MSFMWSYPNFIPLSLPDIRGIVAALEPHPFERLYGAFWPSIVKTDAKAAVRRSAERYIRRSTASHGTVKRCSESAPLMLTTGFAASSGAPQEVKP